MKELYNKKTPSYFSSVRCEILDAIPKYSEKVLEIGCGTGETLCWLKEIDRCGETTGVELVEHYAKIAEAKIDRAIISDIEKQHDLFPEERFDLILCLDVLEHLRDPWETLGKIVQTWLAPEGTLIVSLPNIRYLTVLSDLLIHGKFEYQDAGILDRTHLRFFTKESAVSLLESASLKDVQILLHPQEIKGKAGIINAITFGFFRDIFSWQIILKGSKS